MINRPHHHEQCALKQGMRDEIKHSRLHRMGRVEANKHDEQAE